MKGRGERGKEERRGREERTYGSDRKEEGAWSKDEREEKEIKPEE